MEEGEYRLIDLGDRRVLSVGGREHVTVYSERVLRMLIERKGAERAALYLPFRETRGRHFLSPLVRHLRSAGADELSVLEVGCSFGHITECLAEEPLFREVYCFDTDRAFVDITRAKVEEMGLKTVREVAALTSEDTCRLPYADARFDVVLAIGVVEHLGARRRIQVDEYYRVLAPSGLIAILDTPNRWFPLETHSVGLPFVQWMPARLAYAYARLGRPRAFRHVSYPEFTAEGTGWRNASLGECLPSAGRAAIEDVTEVAGYGWRFFRDTARSSRRCSLLPMFALAVAALRLAGQPPSLCLPYLNLAFRKR
jgi:2-polyprenyl-3-methyl-5-hydroxy-6-metoxy-1,4-benzoquinol methylase